MLELNESDWSPSYTCSAIVQLSFCILLKLKMRIWPHKNISSLHNKLRGNGLQSEVTLKITDHSYITITGKGFCKISEKTKMVIWVHYKLASVKTVSCYYPSFKCWYTVKVKQCAHRNKHLPKKCILKLLALLTTRGVGDIMYPMQTREWWGIKTCFSSTVYIAWLQV